MDRAQYSAAVRGVGDESVAFSLLKKRFNLSHQRGGVQLGGNRLRYVGRHCFGLSHSVNLSSTISQPG